MELNVQDWKEYQVDKLFTVVLSKGDIKEDDMDSGTVRLVSSGESDNGIVTHIDSKGDGKAEIFDGNVITADMFCNAYYQDESFYAVSHGRVNILQPKFNLNSHIGLFISTIINNEKYKYSYGRALYSNVVSSMVIKLPTQIDKANGKYIIDENRTYSDEGYIPDWQFMEDYIKSLHHKPITTKVKSGIVKKLDVANWEEFTINHLFDIYTGGDLVISELEVGSIPVASNSCENNNIAFCTTKIHGRKLFNHKISISIADRGCFHAFIQPKDFYIATRVKALVIKDTIKITLKQLCFIVSVINQESFKFSYGRNCCANLPYIKIKLPIKHNSNGCPAIDKNRTYSDNGYIPDWQYMEDYINSLPYSDRI